MLLEALEAHEVDRFLEPGRRIVDGDAALQGEPGEGARLEAVRGRHLAGLVGEAGPECREDGLGACRRQALFRCTPFAPYRCKPVSVRGGITIKQCAVTARINKAAVIVLMAASGCFVPADSAVIGPVDRIFSRIGASDDLAGGRSTFMVEMEETANILHNATAQSLVLMDEIGRGTSTFDGLSLAWACAVELASRIHAYTLFATHYFELTTLPEEQPSIANVHLDATEHGDSIVFLHSVKPGPANQSYGLQVAQLAGVPRPVISRARRRLQELEEAAVEQASTNQLSLFASDPCKKTVSDPLREALEAMLGDAPRERLTRHGWHLANPMNVACDPFSYRDYLQASKGEFSVAKHGYVVSHSGWFSERSACYLASGRPVVLEDTGFTDWLDSGRGLLAFRRLDEAVEALRLYVEEGERASWWTLEIDPAAEALRERAEYPALLAAIKADIAQQRARLMEMKLTP